MTMLDLMGCLWISFLIPEFDLIPCCELVLSKTVIFSCSKSNSGGNSLDTNVKIYKRAQVVCQGMLMPRKFMQKRRKVEVFKSAEDKADQKNWRKMMNEIEETGSAVSVLRSQMDKNQALPKDLVLGSLVRFKQLKKWNLVGEVWTLLSSMSFEVLLQLSSFMQTLANIHLCIL